MWWSGMGLLGVIIPGSAGVGGYFLLQGLGLGVMGVGVGIILGSLLTRWLAAKINKQEEGAAGGVYSVPLKTWSVVTCIIGALILLRAVVHAVAGW
jgi:ABC-type lipoprotein release transport system permease subunit